MLTVFIFIIICIKIRVWNPYIYFAIYELTSPLERRESIRNQVTGYELTFRMWLRVDFLGTG